MAKKTIKARIDDIERKVGAKDGTRIWIAMDGICTTTAPDGTMISMTEAEFDAKYPDARKVGFSSDIDQGKDFQEGVRTQGKGTKTRD